ncbi:MAG: NgoMIV family type II restriction endonuclease [Pseudomonadota bacterium]
MTQTQAFDVDYRRAFHAELVESGVLSMRDGVASNADRSSNPSKRLAAAIYAAVTETAGDAAAKLPGQTAGAQFEQICARYVEAAFADLHDARPGDWIIGCDGVQGGTGLAHFEQFSHLALLERLANENPKLKAAIGSDYMIKPDVLIARRPQTDARLLDEDRTKLDLKHATRTPLRLQNSGKPLLHATISCKWTMRSDRAQNARTEALNLMKNRKGRVPHMVVITGEPTPGRLASLAYGTGEVDCVYHFALSELIAAVEAEDMADDTLRAMLDGNRLRDISDLPFDLAI